MKKTIFLFVVFSVLFILTACSFRAEPTTSIEAIISPLTEDEFERVGTHELENPHIDDFRKFTLNVEVNNVAGQKVHFAFSDSWKEALDSLDATDRYWFGGGGEQNNESENFAKHTQEFFFYSKGLNEGLIREALNTIIFEVRIDNGGEIVTEEYKVGDLVEFE